MTMSTLQLVALAELFLGWVVWSFAFVKPQKQAKGKEKVERAPASRWGVFLVMCGYASVWIRVQPVGFVKSSIDLVLSMLLVPAAVALAWAAAHQLGKQWRFEAALSADHELVQGGPYRYVRHPIYSSMFLMLLATGLAWSWWPMLLLGILFFVVGTEIRVRAEERLLTQRFGSQYDAFKARTWAYVPFLR